MTLPPFELLQPQTVEEALELLATPSGAVPTAGGTCLLVDLRARRCTARTLVDLSLLSDLQEIRIEGDSLVLGAMVTIADVLRSTPVAQHAPGLTAACRQFAAPLIRHRATLGGNLAHASPAADTAPPLLVLDAAVDLAARSGSRRVPLSEFFLSPCQTARRPDELLVSIRVPLSSTETRWAYEKIGLRKADAISVVSASALHFVKEDRVHLAVGAVAPTPLRLLDAETVLATTQLSPAAIDQAVARSMDLVRPIDDVRGSAAYRRRMVGVLVKRCLVSLRDAREGAAHVV